MSKDDLFTAEKVAIKYCEQYGYAPYSEEWKIASNAFCVAYRIATKENIKNEQENDNDNGRANCAG